MVSPMRLFLCLLIFSYHFTVAGACRLEFVSEMAEQRCMTAQGTSAPMTAEQPVCAMICAQHTLCRSFNYNFVENKCVLNEGPCLHLMPSIHFLAVIFGDAQAEVCLRWVPIVDFSAASAIPTSPCNAHSDFATCYVGRLVYTPHVLPGKYQDTNKNIYSVLRGAEESNGIKEVLQVTNGCDISWVSFTAGGTVPSRAVVGGYLADGAGSNLYVIRGVVSGFKFIGYYDPASEHGYVESGGAHMITQMEVLVLA